MVRARSCGLRLHAFGLGLLIFIQVLVGNVILRDLMRSDFPLIGAGGFNATDHIGLERIAFLEQLGDAF